LAYLLIVNVRSAYNIDSKFVTITVVDVVINYQSNWLP